jgi:hypothetical protein
MLVLFDAALLAFTGSADQRDRGGPSTGVISRGQYI